MKFALIVAVLVSLPSCLGSEWYTPGLPHHHVGRTEFDKTDDFVIAKNLWHHVLRYYAVVETERFNDTQYASPFADILFTQNVAVCKLPVSDVASLHSNIAAGWVAGTTLWVDFPFPAFPENMGHWVEGLLPLYSGLTTGDWLQHVPTEGRTIQALLFANLRRAQIEAVPWVMEMIKLALQPGLQEGQELPRMLFYDELEQLSNAQWVGFERVLHVYDRYKHPAARSGFYTPEIAATFRLAAYAATNVSRPPGWEQRLPPRTITYLMSPGGEQVVNNGEVMAALHEVGAAFRMAVHPYTVTSAAPFTSFVSTMAQTGLLVARHGPLLANAVFLPPGAMVLELLPYNWEWQGISEIYVNMTRSVGVLHHFAWKADSPQWAAYASDDDAKYSHWDAHECSSRYCLEAHARAGMLVDVATIKTLLQELLPAVLRGAEPAALASRRPWPQRPQHSGSTGLWWDVE